MKFELLVFYYEVERPEFMRDAKFGVEEFEPVWDKLAEIIRDQKRAARRLVRQPWRRRCR